MDFSVVVRAREDGSDPKEILRLASIADDLGFPELWIGEGPTWDAFVLAGGVGSVTKTASLTVGPMPVSVRDPATISRGAGSLASLTGRTVGVALGTASTRVVERLHGRSRRRAASDLRAAARTIRELIDSSPEQRWTGDPDAAFLRKLSVPNGPLTVAAFGERAIRTAADYADRMLLDLVTPEQVSQLRDQLESASSGRPRPRLTAWLPTAVEPTDQALRLVSMDIAGYLTIGGYREMFIAAGFQAAVERADEGAGIQDRIDALPRDAPHRVGLVGDRPSVVERLQAYADAGLDEVAIVPVTAGDPGGERTLRTLRSFF